MMPRVLLNTALIGGLMCGTLAAQELPDFSGTWVMDVSHSEAAMQPDHARGRPTVQVITQAPGLITVNRDINGQPETIDYILPTSEPQPVGTSGAAPLATLIPNGSALWRDQRLETTVQLMIKGRAVTRTERRTLDPSGTRMTVETKVTVQHGYDWPSTDTPNIGEMRDVYIKQPVR
jgi:hypothetical protein